MFKNNNEEAFSDCIVKNFNSLGYIKNGGQLIMINANPSLGFDYPYLLFLPTNLNNNSTIIVEGANTGRDTKQVIDINNCDKVIQESLDDVRKCFVENNNPIEVINEQTTNYPLLYPLFPRLHYKGTSIYNHMLSSNSMFSSNYEKDLKKLGLYRTDLQLIEMISDAKKRLLEYGINIDERIIITGFSASAKFANRFTLLHPEIVKYTIAGGVSGTITLPLREINGEKLLWPIGIGNVPEITDEKLKIYKDVPQYYYQGMQDINNDPYELNKDGTCAHPGILQDEEAIQLHKLLGKSMNEDRWCNTKKIISSLGYEITLASFEGGHDPNIANDAVREILSNMINQKNLGGIKMLVKDKKDKTLFGMKDPFENYVAPTPEEKEEAARKLGFASNLEQLAYYYTIKKIPVDPFNLDEWIKKIDFHNGNKYQQSKVISEAGLIEELKRHLLMTEDEMLIDYIEVLQNDLDYYALKIAEAQTKLNDSIEKAQKKN